MWNNLLVFLPRCSVLWLTLLILLHVFLFFSFQESDCRHMPRCRASEAKELQESQAHLCLQRRRQLWRIPGPLWKQLSSGVSPQRYEKWGCCDILLGFCQLSPESEKLGLLLMGGGGVLEKKREVVDILWWSVLEARGVDVWALLARCSCESGGYSSPCYSQLALFVTENLVPCSERHSGKALESTGAEWESDQSPRGCSQPYLWAAWPVLSVLCPCLCEKWICSTCVWPWVMEETAWESL